MTDKQMRKAFGINNLPEQVYKIFDSEVYRHLQDDSDGCFEILHLIRDVVNAVVEPQQASGAEIKGWVGHNKNRGIWCYSHGPDYPAPSRFVDWEPVYTHPQPQKALPAGFKQLAHNHNTGEWLYLNHADEWHLCPTPQPPKAVPDSVDDLYLLRKGSFFYRHNSCGYVEDPMLAETYTKEEAEKHVSRRSGEVEAVSVKELFNTWNITPGKIREYTRRMEAMARLVKAEHDHPGPSTTTFDDQEANDE